jgi:hypothetical protein
VGLKQRSSIEANTPHLLIGFAPVTEKSDIVLIFKETDEQNS